MIYRADFGAFNFQQFVDTYKYHFALVQICIQTSNHIKYHQMHEKQESTQNTKKSLF